jgi:hypothetical protein
MGTGELHAHLAAAESFERLAVALLCRRASAHERARSRVDAKRPIGPGGLRDRCEPLIES